MNGRTDDNAAWWYLDRHLNANTADAVCLIADDEELTYRQLHARVGRAARVLADSGVAPGDRVVIILNDGVEPVSVVLAAMRIGAVPVPVSPILTCDDHRYIIADCGARVVLVEQARGDLVADFADRFPDTVLWARGPAQGVARCWTDEVGAAEPLGETEPRSAGDDALIQYTSGSTGEPKGVVHLHGGLLAFPRGLGKHLGITREDRFLSTAKLPFGYGFGNSLLLPFSVGASAVLFSGRAEPHAVAALLRRTRPTLLFAVPTLYAALLAMPQASERLDFSSVRLAVSAGEHLGAHLSGRLTETFGLKVVNGLGATECLHIFIATEPGISRPGVTGVCVPGFDAEVRDDDGSPLGPGETGHLYVRGTSVADRYWNRPEASAETFREGWVRTGDTMMYDRDDGWIYLGRSDNIINVGGMKVFPSEIEDEITKVPGVDSCAVVGIPDENDVVHITAYVVPEAEAQEVMHDRVLTAVRHTLPAYKRPRTIRVVRALPTTSTGKTAHWLIRRQETERR